MSVPETAMNENRDASREENDIRASGKVASLKSISVAHAPEKATNDAFGTRVVAPDQRHSRTSLFPC